MATSMPPWPDWQFEYMGSRFLGRVLSLWSSLWVSVVRKLFQLLTKASRSRREASSWDSDGYNFPNGTQQSETEFSFARKLSRMAVSTLLTVGVWRIVTLKAVWLAVGAGGDRILAAVLLFVSASWVISLVWICFSKSESKKTRRMARQLHKPIYTGSSDAKAS